MIKNQISLTEKVVRHFRDEGYNCSQSVLLTMFEHWGCNNELIPKVATAFGAGMGRCGSVCGALTGGLMAIGIKYGTNEPSVEKRTRASQIAGELYRKFEKQNGTVMCRELIGFDLSDEKQRSRAIEEDVFELKCSFLLKRVVEFLDSISDFSV